MKRKSKVLAKETQDEMVGVLTAISIVSKRLARRLSDPGEDEPKNKRKSTPESEVRT